MRRTGAVLMLALAIAAGVYSAPGPVRSYGVVAVVDTVGVHLHWSRVSAPGQRVSTYRWELRAVAGPLLASGETSDTTVIVQVVVVADSLMAFARSWAVEARGQAGRMKESAPFAIFPRLPAPDTVIVEQPIDSVRIVFSRLLPMIDGRYTLTAIGEEVEVCLLEYRGGVASPRTDPQPVWSVLDDPVVAFGDVGPSGSHCVMLIALQTIHDLEALGMWAN